jgi:hypothetical protein
MILPYNSIGRSYDKIMYVVIIHLDLVQFLRDLVIAC